MIAIKYGPIGQINLEEAVVAEASMQLIAERMERSGRTVPKYFADHLTGLTRWINSKLRAEKERELENLKLRIEALKPEDQKLAEAKARAAVLEAELRATP